MKGKRRLWFYHIGQENLKCQDDFFAFFLFNIQILSPLGGFTVIHSMASSQDLGKLKMPARKAKCCIATLLQKFFLLVSITCRDS